MADEPGVDERDAVTGGRPVEELGGLGGVGGGPYVESQRPQLAFERRPGYRRAREDCGRQTNSLLEHGYTPEHGFGSRTLRVRARAGGAASAEAIG
ncbi:hypothetical protein GCM10010329_42310 [Streptomyces spiroverticillatus]|uniref:Uncharacterized protein n=1 Tax=Streptomyces finlayi TaxID=67296 RepID=A0A918WYT9_9ACTN|nr:hypothetical protein [Streptomyces finlayi]GHA14902.1 hypothetical protein GCM10010329_42310 [Streptomyces spiroverticillatus]GHC97032.1 hypothetical protein GCM10010334_37930 [Streptomyces finlayi]